MVGTANRRDDALDAINGVRRYALPRWAQNVLGFAVGTLLVAGITLGLRDHERIALLDQSILVIKEDLKEIKDKQRSLDKTYQGLLRELLELKAEFIAHRRSEKE